MPSLTALTVVVVVVVVAILFQLVQSSVAFSILPLQHHRRRCCLPSSSSVSYYYLLSSSVLAAATDESDASCAADTDTDTEKDDVTTTKTASASLRIPCRASGVIVNNVSHTCESLEVRCQMKMPYFCVVEMQNSSYDTLSNTYLLLKKHADPMTLMHVSFHYPIII